MMGKNIFPIISAAAVILLPALFAPSCANTTQAPTGGAKDTIPPVIVKLSPLPGSTGVPVSKTSIVFTFDEYVSIKNAASIFLSPPQEKRPEAKVRGKSVVVTFPEDLSGNTTYTLSLNDAIADNNEGNIFQGFTYVFSTGDQIDSMYMTGLVQDCINLDPVKGATVLLYKDQADSAVFLRRPFAAARTDDWGFFSIPFIQDTLYRIYAIKDANNNNIYDPDTETVGFLDFLVRPVGKVNDTIPELGQYDMKDTLACLARKAGYELSLFREKPVKQYIVNKVRTAERSAYVTFMAPNAWIDSIWVRGLSDDKLITQFNIEQDSLELWINERKRIPDTLHLFVNYRKTDTLGALKPEVESVTVVERNEGIIEFFKQKILPQFGEAGAKIRVVQADAFEFMPAVKDGEYDFCFADIWNGLQEEKPFYALRNLCGSSYRGMKMAYWLENATGVKAVLMEGFAEAEQERTWLQLAISAKQLRDSGKYEFFAVADKLMQDVVIRTMEDIEYYWEFANIKKLCE